MFTGIVQSHCAVTLIGGGEVTAATVTDALTIAPHLVAADGGADVALRLGFMPEAVIGDFDSISAQARAAILPARLHPIAEQDSTDFDKCLRNIAAPFILAVGFTGARVDHALAVFYALTQHPDKRCLILGPQDVCFLAPPEVTLHLPPATRLSLFPMGAVSGTSTGLRWPINGLTFAPNRTIGTSNETNAATVTLTFDAPDMLVILPAEQLEAAIAGLTGSPLGPPPVRGE